MLLTAAGGELAAAGVKAGLIKGGEEAGTPADPVLALVSLERGSVRVPSFPVYGLTLPRVLQLFQKLASGDER